MKRLGTSNSRNSAKDSELGDKNVTQLECAGFEGKHSAVIEGARELMLSSIRSQKSSLPGSNFVFYSNVEERPFLKAYSGMSGHADAVEVRLSPRESISSKFLGLKAVWLEGVLNLPWIITDSKVEKVTTEALCLRARSEIRRMRVGSDPAITGSSVDSYELYLTSSLCLESFSSVEFVMSLGSCLSSLESRGQQTDDFCLTDLSRCYFHSMKYFQLDV